MKYCLWPVASLLLSLLSSLLILVNKKSQSNLYLCHITNKIKDRLFNKPVLPIEMRTLFWPISVVIKNANPIS